MWFGQHDVVDQPRLADKRRHRHQYRAREIVDRLERLGIHNFEVVEPHRRFLREDLLPSLNQRVAPCAPLDRIALALP